MDYALAFMTGLLGAPHCIGMCSGLVSAFFVHSRTALTMRLAMYHGARLLIYVLIGISGAFLGRVVEQSGIFGKGQGVLMIVAGIIVILLGGYTISRSRQIHSCPEARYQPARGTVFAPVIGGVINGLIPCSLVFSVAIKAAATAPLNAAILMLFFGLGTLPGVMPVSLVAAAFTSGRKGLWLRLGGACVIALGVKTTYEGVVFFDIMRGLAN
jgi:sulfite exporter TauE/SafE